MSAGFPFNGAPGGGGFPGGPAAAPPAQGAPRVGSFVLNIPADPTWEPFETTDTLDHDGYYCARIKQEKERTDQNKKPGVFFTLELLDQDAAGKTLSKFMVDPNSTQGNTWWTWRSLIRSIAGMDYARAQMQYQPGMFTGKIVYMRTQAYLDDQTTRTGVDAFVSEQEYKEAVGGNRHRWPAKMKTGGGGGSGVGALPGGLPGGFSGGGLPGTPSMPGGSPFPSTVGAVGAPPTGAAAFPTGTPAQTTPAQTAPTGTPPVAAGGFVFPTVGGPAAASAPAAAPQQAAPQQAAPQAAPAAPFAFPAAAQQGQGGVPQPAAASPFAFAPNGQQTPQ